MPQDYAAAYWISGFQFKFKIEFFTRVGDTIKASIQLHGKQTHRHDLELKSNVCYHLAEFINQWYCQRHNNATLNHHNEKLFLMPRQITKGKQTQIKTPHT